MRVLIDIGHPAHVHLFKNFAWAMQNKGNDIFFTCREKEYEIYLLEHYGFQYKSFGKKYLSDIGKLWGLIEFGIKEFMQGLSFNPDIFLSHGSIYAAHAAWLLSKPHISLEDTGNWEQIRLYLPFTDVVLTPDVMPNKYGDKQISYAGYHELAYLHPNWFKSNGKITDYLPVKKNEKYAILRFVSWRATHDKGFEGLTDDNKIKVVTEFSKYAKVFISTENDVCPELESYKIKIPPEKMHIVLANAIIFYGESATMSSESAVLGTPAIYIDKIGRCYTDDEEKYGLVYNFKNTLSDQNRSIEKGIELLNDINRKQNDKKYKQNILRDKIDVTAFLVWFIEYFPESFKIMKENPDYQYNFK